MCCQKTSEACRLPFSRNIRKGGAWLFRAAACELVDMNRRTFRREPPEDKDAALRARMREIAEMRRRFGAPRLHSMLRREGLVINHKRTARVYREEKLSLRLKKRNKRPSHARVPQVGPLCRDEQWSMVF